MKYAKIINFETAIMKDTCDSLNMIEINDSLMLIEMFKQIEGKTFLIVSENATHYTIDLGQVNFFKLGKGFVEEVIINKTSYVKKENIEVSFYLEKLLSKTKHSLFRVKNKGYDFLNTDKYFTDGKRLFTFVKECLYELNINTKTWVKKDCSYKFLLNKFYIIDSIKIENEKNGVYLSLKNCEIYTVKNSRVEIDLNSLNGDFLKLV